MHDGFSNQHLHSQHIQAWNFASYFEYMTSLQTPKSSKNLSLTKEPGNPFWQTLQSLGKPHPTVHAIDGQTPPKLVLLSTSDKVPSLA